VGRVGVYARGGWLSRFQAATQLLLGTCLFSLPATCAHTSCLHRPHTTGRPNRIRFACSAEGYWRLAPPTGEAAPPPVHGGRRDAPATVTGRAPPHRPTVVPTPCGVRGTAQDTSQSRRSRATTRGKVPPENCGLSAGGGTSGRAVGTGGRSPANTCSTREAPATAWWSLCRRPPHHGRLTRGRPRPPAREVSAHGRPRRPPPPRQMMVNFHRSAG